MDRSPRAPRLTTLSEMATGVVPAAPWMVASLTPRPQDPRTSLLSPRYVYYVVLQVGEGGDISASCKACFNLRPTRQPSHHVARQGARTGAQLPAAAPRPIQPPRPLGYVETLRLSRFCSRRVPRQFPVCLSPCWPGASSALEKSLLPGVSSLPSGRRALVPVEVRLIISAAVRLRRPDASYNDAASCSILRPSSRAGPRLPRRAGGTDPLLAS